MTEDEIEMIEVRHTRTGVEVYDDAAGVKQLGESKGEALTRLARVLTAKEATTDA